jgi:hypothetical protein
MDSVTKICPIMNELKAKWEKVLVSRYENSFMPVINVAIMVLEKITYNFYSLGLNDNNFDKEILSGDEAKYHQRMSEILVSDRLLRDGFKLSSAEKGPDFKAVKDDSIIWFEVITPTPDTSLSTRLTDKNTRLCPTPENNENINHHLLLKMTGAVKEKYKKIEGYIRDGIIKPNDRVVIVVNDSLLSPLDMYMIGVNYEIVKGNSGLPLVVEALLGIGNSLWVESDEGGNYQIVRSERNTVLNHNNATISTNYFLNDHYKDLSGVFVLTLREDYGISRVIYDDTENRGVVLTNENSFRPLSKKLISAQFCDHEAIKKLMSPSSEMPVRSMITKTLTGYYFDMMAKLRTMSGN